MLALMLAACQLGDGGSGGSGDAPSKPPSPASSTTTNAPTTTTAPASARACGTTTTPPEHYDHVVIIAEENRTWSSVGGAGFASMPYLHELAQQCSYFPDWTETNTGQSSLTQYIGFATGTDNTHTVDDCSPSPTCSTTDDNIFRQVRDAGGSARSYVEGSTQGCSASGNADKHVPALYMWSTADRAACETEVRPLDELDVDHLPTFAFITPDLCNDGHDCANSTVDGWLRSHLGAILAGSDYQEGATAVVVFYDEDHPVPNLIIAPSTAAGARPGPGSHAALLRTVEEWLGLPLIEQAPVQSATSLRSATNT